MYPTKSRKFFTAFMYNESATSPQRARLSLLDFSRKRFFARKFNQIYFTSARNDGQSFNGICRPSSCGAVARKEYFSEQINTQAEKITFLSKFVFLINFFSMWTHCMQSDANVEL